MDLALPQKKYRNDGKLINAIEQGDLDSVLSELGQCDIDLNMKICGKSLLETAGRLGHKEIARQLILHGANPNETRGKNCNSLLHFAAQTGNYGFASILLEHDANASPLNRFSQTPLHLAARTGQEYLTKLLIEHSADIQALDSQERTPLHLANKKGYLQIANILRRGGQLSPDTNSGSSTLVAEENPSDFKNYSF